MSRETRPNFAQGSRFAKTKWRCPAENMHFSTRKAHFSPHICILNKILFWKTSTLFWSFSEVSFKRVRAKKVKHWRNRLSEGRGTRETPPACRSPTSGPSGCREERCRPDGEEPDASRFKIEKNSRNAAPLLSGAGARQLRPCIQ